MTGLYLQSMMQLVLWMGKDNGPLVYPTVALLGASPLFFSHLEGTKALIDYTHLHVQNSSTSYAWHIQIKHISTIAGKHIGLRFYWSFPLSVCLSSTPLKLYL